MKLYVFDDESEATQNPTPAAKAKATKPEAQDPANILRKMNVGEIAKWLSTLAAKGSQDVPKTKVKVEAKEAKVEEPKSEVLPATPVATTTTRRRRRRENYIQTVESDNDAGRRVEWGLSGKVSIEALRQKAPEWFLPKIPEEVTPKRALWKAVTEFCKAKGRFHEQHPKGGWAICSIAEVGAGGEATLDMKVSFRLYLDDKNRVQAEAEGADEKFVAETLKEIRHQVNNELKSELDSTEISMILTATVLEVLGGRPIVRRGSYYLPPWAGPKWDELVTLFDEVSDHFLSNTYVVKTDARFLGKLGTDLAGEVEGKLAEMRGELEQEVGRRRVSARLSEIAEAKTKLGIYEKVLGMKFDPILAQLDEVRQAYEATATRGSLLEVN